MLVVEKHNFSLHNPSWKLHPRAGNLRHQGHAAAGRADPRGTGRPTRASASRRRKRHPDTLLARLHPYHDFIKKTSQTARKTGEEIYPDLFPGEGAQLQRKIHPLWGGLWCTDAVTPIMGRTYEVAKGSAEAAMTGADILLAGKQREVYALCRPSGHHAGPRVFGGYCYFNNTATAAELLAPHGTVADSRHRLPPRQRHTGVLRGAKGRLHLLDPRRPEQGVPVLLGLHVGAGHRTGRGTPTSTSRCRWEPETTATSRRSIARSARSGASNRRS